ncbi:MAG: PAS domain S-box protein [Rhodoferax sp.]|nr:PAS domain S-box protein [Rhodoferax sp.]MDD5480024.1 PAS domain S-box protein [Rhodoferax sp.]
MLTKKSAIFFGGKAKALQNGAMTITCHSTPLGLYTSETELQALINATPGISLLIDLEGTIVCANSKSTTHFGIELGELIGRNVFSLFDEATSIGRRSIVKQAETQRVPVFLEDERNGVHYRHSLIPAIDHDGVVRRVAVFAEDITERKKAEIALRASEEKFRFLAENTADTVWQLDGQMRFTYVNAAYTHLSGFSQEEIIGRPVMEFFTPQGRTTVAAMMVKRKENEALGKVNVALRFEVPHIRKSGKPFWAEINSNPIYGQNGVITAFNGIMRDIDERKNMELALRVSEERFRFLAENTGDVVWELDSQMRFTYINGADQRLRGFSKDEVLGRSVLELFTPEGKSIITDLSAKRRADEELGKVDPQFVFRAPQIRKDGTSVWTEVSSTTSYNPDGRVIGYNGITRDIDASKQHERRLEDANVRLQEQLQEILALQTQLKEQAVRDSLTGLHNRRYMEETLPRELSRAKREGYSLALIMLDLDHFKRINDTYGHPTGDSVLKAMASILLHGAREGDIICRYGGEEFLVALPNMSTDQALVRAKNWQSTLAARPVIHGTFSVEATFSAGISVYPDNSSEVEGLLRLVDNALYRAKENGRNCVEYEPMVEP